jgi:hypothetical protein
VSSIIRAWILSAALALLAFANARAAADQPASHDSSSDTSTLEEVTVTAQRAKLAKRVDAFVSNITGPLFGAGLVRWGKPVCPLVSGLPRDEGEFILGRLSDIARAAGVPLADEKCLPNLYILVTTQPQELLKDMEKRNFVFTFGFSTGPPVPGVNFTTRSALSPAVIHEFISKPAPVRILYRDTPSTPTPSYAYVRSAKVGPITFSGDNWDYRNVTWHVFRVFEIIDQGRLKGMTLGQFADYVAMVGLAQLKPSDGLADAPTILKLFNDAPQAAPAGMTDWDRAFLRFFYTSESYMFGQRWHLTQAMVNEIAH